MAANTSDDAAAEDALDFDLLIAPDGGGGYRARLLSSPSGTANASFAIPFSDLEVENLVLRMGEVRTGLRRIESQQTQAAREFGQRLFDAVLGGELRSCWQSSADEAEQAGKRLRLRLRLSDAPELLDLPWEYLYDSTANRFVALSSNTPLVRFLDLPGRIDPLPVNPPLRILALIASPQDVAALDVEREWSNLQAALADLGAQGRVQIDRCAQPTLPELQRTLRRQEYHIFHFVGHGGYDSNAGDGVLLFEDEQRRSRPVSGSQLGALLHDEGHLRLVVLNACEGARTSRSDPFAGVGQSLLQQGVPAVIAMQFAITDVAASTFAREFYAALADGYPVDRALAEARKAMFAQSDSVEWGTPVLYLRPVAETIFSLLAPPVQAAPPAPVPAPAPAPSPAPVSTSAPAAGPMSAQTSTPPHAARSEQVAVVHPPETQRPVQAAASTPARDGKPHEGKPREGKRGLGPIGLIIALALVIVAAGGFWLLWMLSNSSRPNPAAPAAAVAQPPVSTAQPAFRYTFEDGSAAGWMGDPGEWAVIPDETGANFIYQGTAPQDSYTNSEPPDKAAMSIWRNYAVHMRLRAHQAGGSADLAEFWLTTRAPLDQAAGCSYYDIYFNFRIKRIMLDKSGSDPNCQNVRIADGSYPALEVGKWYDVVVTMREDHIQVTVDGEQVIDAQDGDVRQGYAFFNVGDWAIVQLDDVEVYKLD